MSTGACIALAIMMILGAACSVAIGIYLGPELPGGPPAFYGLAAFCIVVATACLVRKSRPVTLRIIGAVIFLTSAYFTYRSYGEKSFIHLLIGLIVFGLPSGYLAIFGKYPNWGAISGAFDSQKQ